MVETTLVKNLYMRVDQINQRTWGSIIKAEHETDGHAEIEFFLKHNEQSINAIKPGDRIKVTIELVK